jgi:hypothetical protein
MASLVHAAIFGVRFVVSGYGSMDADTAAARGHGEKASAVPDLHRSVEF